MCCGNPAPTNNHGSPMTATGYITGYAVELPDGRTATYLTKSEAEAARTSLGISTPVKEVHARR